MKFSYRHGSLVYQQLLHGNQFEYEMFQKGTKKWSYRAGRLQYITILFLSLDTLLGKSMYLCWWLLESKMESNKEKWMSMNTKKYFGID